MRRYLPMNCCSNGYAWVAGAVVGFIILFPTGIWLTVYGYQKGLLVAKLLGLSSVVCCVCGAPVGFLCFRYWRRRTASSAANRDIELLSAEQQISFDNIETTAAASRPTLSTVPHQHRSLQQQQQPYRLHANGGVRATTSTSAAAATATSASSTVYVSRQLIATISV